MPSPAVPCWLQPDTLVLVATGAAADVVDVAADGGFLGFFLLGVLVMVAVTVYVVVDVAVVWSTTCVGTFLKVRVI